eukprot:CAMPEP_0198549382 /NCGR_PEP_ID=MMETSP1462-20131121/72662_1 /TAXON_ID=1333877 /ORGANISM="Brandtodinium nutriculum, Strain RCC3387" /LENGTH=77 /DNA_ID=CAMNT_0044279957 /DNA_START=19 /DNA_END=249 /DNA_ORIENTATION=+
MTEHPLSCFTLDDSDYVAGRARARLLLPPADAQSGLQLAWAPPCDARPAEVASEQIVDDLVELDPRIEDRLPLRAHG